MSLCQCAEHMSVSHYMDMFYFTEKLCPFIYFILFFVEFIDLYYWIVLLQYVHEPNSHVLQVLCTLEAVDFTMCWTHYSCVFSQIHGCIVDYLSAINIYETKNRKCSQRSLYHSNLLSDMCIHVRFFHVTLICSEPNIFCHNNWLAVPFKHILMHW